MKKILAMIAMILMVSVLTACGSKEEKVDFNVEEVAAEMVEAAWGDVMAFPVQLEQYTDSGMIDANIISEFAGTAGSMIDANRMLLIEVKDVKDLPAAEALAKQEQENLINAFKEYLPAPRVIAEASQVITKGKYVLFISHENADKIIEIFNAQFTK